MVCDYLGKSLVYAIKYENKVKDCVSVFVYVCVCACVVWVCMQGVRDRNQRTQFSVTEFEERNWGCHGDRKEAYC